MAQAIALGLAARSPRVHVVVCTWGFSQIPVPASVRELQQPYPLHLRVVKERTAAGRCVEVAVADMGDVCAALPAHEAAADAASDLLAAAVLDDGDRAALPRGEQGGMRVETHATDEAH